MNTLSDPREDVILAAELFEQAMEHKEVFSKNMQWRMTLTLANLKELKRELNNA